MCDLKVMVTRANLYIRHTLYFLPNIAAQTVDPAQGCCYKFWMLLQILGPLTENNFGLSALRIIPTPHPPTFNTIKTVLYCAVRFLRPAVNRGCGLLQFLPIHWQEQDGVVI